MEKTKLRCTEEFQAPRFDVDLGSTLSLQSNKETENERFSLAKDFLLKGVHEHPRHDGKREEGRAG